MDATADKIKKSLRYSILDGSFYSVMVGFGESFFPAFGVFLKATSFQLGLLTSLPQTVGYLSQLLTNKFLAVFKSRKTFVNLMALLQGLTYLPVSLLMLNGKMNLTYLIFFACLYYLLGMLPVPAWSSWMGDLVAEKVRGAYFGSRNNIIGLVNFGSFLTAGYLLQDFSKTSPALGFALIFGIALLARVISFFWLCLKYEPPFILDSDARAGFSGIWKMLKVKNFGIYVAYQAMMNFALYMAAPFFAPYILRDMNYNYQMFTIITAAVLVSKYLAMPIWGKLSDKYGAKKILGLSGYLLPLNPLLWVLSTNFWWLIFAQIYAGFVWAGFELSSFIFIYDMTIPEKRTTAVACNNSINGLAILAGSISGSFLVGHNQLFWSKYYLVFIASFLLRYLTSVIFIPKLEEVRAVEKISYRQLVLEILSSVTTRGLVYNLMTFRKKK